MHRLRAGGWDADVRVTTADHAPEEAAAASDTPFVGALGGDGYIAAVAHGLAGSDRVLVPLPGGRGNDLCRAIGAGPDPLARADAVAGLGRSDAEVVTARIRPLDGMWVEDLTARDPGRVGIDLAAAGHGRRLALGVVSLGLDAWANKIANESWISSGPLAYGWGAVMAPRRFHGAAFHARVDGVERHLPGWVFSVSNSGFIGGGVHVVPASDPCDGILELFRVDQVSMPRVVSAVIRVVAARNAHHPLVHVDPVHEVDVLGPQGLPAMADGDVIGHLPLRVTVAPGVVRVLV